MSVTQDNPGWKRRSAERERAERRRVETALRRSEARFRQLVSNSPSVIFAAKPDLTPIYVSPNVTAQLGYAPDEILRDPEFFVKCLHPGDVPRMRAAISQLLEHDHASGIHRFLHKDGTFRWVHDEIKLMRDAAGQPLEVIGYLIDITERRQAEEALQYRVEMENLISAVSTRFINVPQTAMDDEIGAALRMMGVFTGVDRAYVFQLSDGGRALDNTHEWCAAGIEPQIDRLHGIPCDRFPWLMARLSHFEVIHMPRVADLPAEANAERESFRAHGIQSAVVVPLVYGESLVGFLGFDSVRREKYWPEEDVALLKVMGEIIVNAIERKRAEATLAEERASLASRVAERTAELSAANAELARAARLKDEFLANMSHELRTPLNAILGLTEALQEQNRGPLNEHQLKSLRTIEESGRHLLSLINDILDLSKVGAGKLELQLEPVAVDMVCQASLMFVKQAAVKKRIRVSFDGSRSPATILADQRRLKQVLVNLLSNAVKFTAEGGQIGLEVTGDPEWQVVHFAVWDTGIGIAQEDLRRLFKPFVQLDSSLARQYEGTGLGLALVTRLTELHGGSVSVDSQPGQGSRFTVTLPWHGAESVDERSDGSVGTLDVPEMLQVEPGSQSVLISQSDRRPEREGSHPSSARRTSHVW